MSTQGTQRDPRSLHERIIEYLRRAGWWASNGQIFRKAGNWVVVSADSTTCVARHIAAFDGVDVSEVTGRKPTPNETSLLRYMMAGRETAVPRFVAPPLSRQARDEKPFCVDTESGCEEQYWPMGTKAEAHAFADTYSGKVRHCRRAKVKPWADVEDMMESARDRVLDSGFFGDWDEAVILAEGVSKEQAQKALDEAVSGWAAKYLASNIFKYGKEVE